MPNPLSRVGRAARAYASLTSGPSGRSGSAFERGPATYYDIRSALESTLPSTSSKWNVLSSQWWSGLDETDKNEVRDWAEGVRRVRNGEVDSHAVKLPPFLLEEKDRYVRASAEGSDGCC